MDFAESNTLATDVLELFLVNSGIFMKNTRVLEQFYSDFHVSYPCKRYLGFLYSSISTVGCSEDPDPNHQVPGINSRSFL